MLKTSDLYNVKRGECRRVVMHRKLVAKAAVVHSPSPYAEVGLFRVRVSLRSDSCQGGHEFSVAAALGSRPRSLLGNRVKASFSWAPI